MTDLELMRLAIEEAAKSEPEDGQLRPRVGAVIALNGEVLAKAHRNENGDGAHAEYVALQKLQARNISAEGTTVYTTLEPCTHRKSGNKIPCAQRLINARVARVVWGVIDPHKTVQSKGILALRNNQVATDAFPHDLASEVEALNVNFLRAFTVGVASTEFIEKHHTRSLDEWYLTINRIYWSQNLRRSPSEIFSHLVETIGGLSQIETGKIESATAAQAYAAKALSWWLALCGRLRVTSVEEILWAKFPGVCPYCEERPHKDACKSPGTSPNWSRLRRLAADRKKPSSVSGWQQLFKDIYPDTHRLERGHIYARLAEELGELGEAVRAFELAPGLFLNEAPDVFAWLLQIQNSLQAEVKNPQDSLERAFCAMFPDVCPSCAAETCQCPAILPSTVGRLGGVIPPTTFQEDGVERQVFMSVDSASKIFGL